MQMYKIKIVLIHRLGEVQDPGCDGKQMEARKPRVKYNASAAKY